MDCSAEVIAGSDHIVIDDIEQNLRADRTFRHGFEDGLYGYEWVRELEKVLHGPHRTYPGRVFVNPLGMGLEEVYVTGRLARMLGSYPGMPRGQALLPVLDQAKLSKAWPQPCLPAFASACSPRPRMPRSPPIWLIAAATSCAT